MIDQLLDELLNKTGVYIYIEQEDKKTYILKQPVKISNNYLSLQEPKQSSDVMVFSDLKFLQFIDKKYKVKPAVGKSIGTVDLNQNKEVSEFKNEFVIETVMELVYEGKFYGYVVYGNTQEVRKYAKD